MKNNDKYNTKEWKNALGMAEWTKSDECTVEMIAQDEYATERMIDKLIDENKKLKSDKELLMKEFSNLVGKIRILKEIDGIDIPFDDTVLDRV